MTYLGGQQAAWAAIVFASATATAAIAEGGSEQVRGWHTAAAVVANVIPVASVFVEERCLPGYIVCKISFWGISVIAAIEQVVVGGNADGARATLDRGFGGDWVVTGEHIATGRKPELYPENEHDKSDSVDPYLPPN